MSRKTYLTQVSTLGVKETLATGVANGSQITIIRCHATGAHSPGRLVFYIYNGSSDIKVGEQSVPISRTGTIRPTPFKFEWRPEELFLNTGSYILKVESTNGGTFDFAVSVIES